MYSMYAMHVMYMMYAMYVMYSSKVLEFYLCEGCPYALLCEHVVVVLQPLLLLCQTLGEEERDPAIVVHQCTDEITTTQEHTNTHVTITDLMS